MQQQNSQMIDEEIDLQQYWIVLKRRRWSILILALLLTLLAVLVVFSITPTYRGTSTVLIEAQQAKYVSIEEVYGLDSGNKEYYQTQYEILKSRRIAERVIDSLNLTALEELNPPKEDSLFSVRDVLISLMILDDVSLFSEQVREAIIERFMERVHVELVKGTQLARIAFDSESPQIAAEVTNAIARAYIDDQMESRLEMTRQATQWLGERIDVLKSNLDQSEKVLQEFLVSESLVDVGGVSTLTAQRLDELTTQVVGSRQRVSELSKRYGPKHPKMVAARAELESAERDLKSSKREIQDIGKKEVTLRELKREVAINRQLYDTFLNRIKETNEAMELQSANARVVDSAVAPIKPVKPKKMLIVALVFIGSIFLGVMLAFLREALDKTFKSASDVEEKLGLPMLGMLPLIKADKKDGFNAAFAMLDEASTSFAESIRTIRTGIVLSSLDNPHKIIVTTSSVPGEGKSTTSINLAIAIGQMERVLLIDADMRRPSVAKSFGLDRKGVGLSELVAGTAEASSCIHTIKEAGIDVITAGMIPPNPLELLSSDRFIRVLEELEKKYDRIVVDSAPVQAVSDSLVLSQHAKAVIYVIKADSTSEQIVKTGVQRLQQYNAPIAGVVINQVDTEKAAKYGYEYGGYYDYYGYSDKES